MKLFLPTSAIAWLCLFSTSIQAQQIFSVPPRLDQEVPDIELTLPEVNQSDPITVPTLEDQDSVQAPKDVVVDLIIFQGNTLISDEEIEGAIAPFKGQTISTTQILEITQAINDLYTQQGYEGSGAIVTERSITEKDQINLKLQIIEAKITDITVEGAGRLKPYIQAQLQSLKDDPLNQYKLYNKLRFTADDDRIEKLDFSVFNQPQLDQKQLKVTVKPEDPINATFLINNGRSPSVGSFERGLSAKHTNLAGIGDRFSVEYRNTEGSNILGLGYRIPVNGSGGEIDVGYLYGNVKAVAEPFSEFDIRSKTQIFSVGFSQPVLRQSNDNMLQEVTLRVGASRTESEDTILNTAFPITEGANDNGRIRSTRIDFGQAFKRHTRKNFLLLSSEFSLGIGLGNTNDEGLGNGEFLKWTGSGLFAQRLTNRLLSLTNVVFQLANRDLIGNEQFTLGGQGSVRGFLSNQLARSNGLNLTQEIRYKAYDKNKHRINLIVFFDFGAGWNNKPQFLENNESLGSVGFGIAHEWAENIRSTVEFGIPLFGPERRGKSLQADGLFLSLQVSF